MVLELAVEDLPLERTSTMVPGFAVEDLSLDRTATMVPEFAVEDLHLDRTASLVPAFAVKTCAWAEHSMMMINLCYTATTQSTPGLILPVIIWTLGRRIVTIHSRLIMP